MKCKLTFNPDQEVEMTDGDYMDLKREGVVVDGSEVEEYAGPGAESVPLTQAEAKTSANAGQSGEGE